MRLLKELIQPICENVEDTQSEIYGEFEDLIKKIKDAKIKSNFVKEMDSAMDTFADGYENDDDNRMYGGLDDMKEIVNNIKSKTK